MASWLSTWHKFLEEHPILNIPVPKDFFDVPEASPDNLAQDEAFWDKVKAQFPAYQDVINLNNGGVSSAPFMVEHAFKAYYTLLNQSPSYFTWKVMENGREVVRQGLAESINAHTDEVAILRNTTEALNNVIFGLPLKAGDEVVACHQDFNKCVASWKQRELREGIKINWVTLEGPSESDAEIVAKYVKAITPETKLIHLTHVINLNGQVMPVKAIIAEAKKRNIEVLLDGAHSFGLLHIDVQELGVDYFTSALHKWFYGPIAAGLLYIAKDKISRVWPLASAEEPLSGNIRKMEELSIQQMPVILGLGFAMEYNLWLGRENKEQRLRYLRRYLVDKLQQVSGLSFITPPEQERQCVILEVALAGWEPGALEDELLQSFGIHVKTVLTKNMHGIRITANIYTSRTELDQVADALALLSKRANAL